MANEINSQKINISVILPVYNVEKYLVKCLNSICNQNFSGTFEIIAVEACSTDNSLAILKSFQLNEPRLKIIEHAVREKMATSRITGINIAIGDYIMHVDSDDWLIPNALEKLFQTCIDTNADIVVFDYITEDNEGKQTYLNNIKRKVVTTNKLKVQNYFYGACWNKIVKRELTNEMIYGEINTNFAEDLIYSTELLLKANTICIIPESYYVYFVNTNSHSWQIQSDYRLNNLVVTIAQIQIITTKYITSDRFLNNLINYLEKHIYLEFAKIHLSKKCDLIISGNCIKTLSQYYIMTPFRLFRLKLSIKYKYFNFIEILTRFGLNFCFSYILRSFKKKLL